MTVLENIKNRTMKNHMQIKKRQDIYNGLATIVFLILLVVFSLIIGFGYTEKITTLSGWEIAMLSLAIFRMIRLFVYDSITQFVRDMFLDVREVRGKIVRAKFDYGFKRSISDVFSCPWCMGVWAGLFLVFFYTVFTSYLYFPVLLMALAGIASFIQILMNMIGWHAEGRKMEVQKKK